jgi:flagellar protein FliL
MSDKKPEPAAPADSAAAAPAKAPGGGIKAFLPVVLAVVLAPAVTWGVAQFVLPPKLRVAIAAPEAGAAAPAPAAKKKDSGHGGGGHGEKPAEPGAAGENYKFENIVVNLAGTMGTRYLKVTFLVVGTSPDLNDRFVAAKAQLGDVTLAVLSALTLADLEESGSKNILRERLLAAYNQALGERIAENLYFSEFVVQ